MRQLTPQEIIEELRHFCNDSASLDSKYSDLLKRHPDQWAGIFMGKLRIAPTFNKLLEYFGNNRRRVAVKFLNSNPKALILTVSCNKTEEDRLAQDRIRSRASRSIVVLEKALFQRCGRYIHLHPTYYASGR